MDRVVIQTPVTPKLRLDAERVAKNQGYSSLQDAIRMYLKKLANEEIQVRLEERFPPVQLSQKASKRYEKMDRDIKSGRVKLKSFDSVEALMKDLNN